MLSNLEQHKRLLQRTNFRPDCDPDLFDQAEWDLLVRYGYWMSALAAGELEPFTDAQRSFVAAATGKSQPQTEFELVWEKLKRALNEKSEASTNGPLVPMTGKTCEICRNTIPLERLEIFPDSTVCRTCQEICVSP